MAHLFQDLLRYYPDDIVTQLQITLPTKIDLNDWLSGLHSRKSGMTLHPINQILLLIFLGSNVEEYFTDQIQPLSLYDSGPWPCLNRVCDNYRQLCITELELLRSTTGKHGEKSLFRGLFTCNCGYQYTRILNRIDGEDIYRGQVKTFGKLWEQRLEILWNDNKVTMKQILRLLGIKNDVLLTEAARCKLSSSSESGRKGRYLYNFLEKLEQRRSLIRQQWEQWLVQDTHFEIGSMYKRHRKEYIWLQNHDKEWLAQHRPVTHSKDSILSGDDRRDTVTRSIRRKDKQEEAERNLAFSIRAATQRMLNSTGFPVQITLTDLCNELGEPLASSKKKEGQNVLQALTESIESHEQYCLRKLYWFINDRSLVQKTWSLRDIYHCTHVTNNSFPPLDCLKPLLNKADWDSLIVINSSPYEEFTEDQWRLLSPFLKVSPGKRLNSTSDICHIMNGVFWKIGTQQIWGNIPLKYAPSLTCWRHYWQLQKSGFWDNVWKTFLSTLSSQEQHRWQQSLETM